MAFVRISLTYSPAFVRARAGGKDFRPARVKVMRTPWTEVIDLYVFSAAGEKQKPTPRRPRISLRLPLTVWKRVAQMILAEISAIEEKQQAQGG